jgi:hypothetical protein
MKAMDEKHLTERYGIEDDGKNPSQRETDSAAPRLEDRGARRTHQGNKRFKRPTKRESNGSSEPTM